MLARLGERWPVLRNIGTLCATLARFAPARVREAIRYVFGMDSYSVFLRDDGSTFVPCPASHLVPDARSQLSHCPPWCAGDHDPLLWLDCCDIVVHSRTLARSTDGRTAVLLLAGEDPVGTDRPRLQLQADPDMAMSASEVLDLAATLKLAAEVALRIEADAV